MKLLLWLLVGSMCWAQSSDTFAITATPIPAKLIKLNYGSLPSGVGALDLMVCNISTTKADLTAAQVYQSLIGADHNLLPLGGSIMLAAILHNQDFSLKSWLNMGLTATTGSLAILGTTKAIASNVTAGIALGALIGQNIVNSFSPALMANQVTTFNDQVLQAQMILDSRSCIERTVFVTTAAAASPKKSNLPVAGNLEFHIK